MELVRSSSSTKFHPKLKFHGPGGDIDRRRLAPKLIRSVSDSKRKIRAWPSRFHIRVLNLKAHRPGKVRAQSLLFDRSSQAFRISRVVSVGQCEGAQLADTPPGLGKVSLENKAS